MLFRHDISFLRAFSVLIVMFFHFNLFLFSGGFIGVDVFFVISGFLMTQIIIKKFEDDSFLLLDFYKRRIVRIIPALQILLWFVLLVSCVFLLKSDVSLNGKYSLLADFFLSNIYFWKYLDYFSSHDTILLHTWTLGVEWQFYLLYPLLLLFLRKINGSKMTFFYLIFILTLFSLILMLVVTKNNNNFAFYMLPTRFWELSIGGCAYFWSLKIKLNKTTKNYLGVAAITVLVLCSLLITDKILWPSWYTIIPVIAAVALLVINVDFKLFQLPVVKCLGNVSYSLYLWHWVWYVILNNFGYASGKYVVVLIVISFFSAFISYRYVECNPMFGKLPVILTSMGLISIFSIFLFFRPNNSLTDKISIYKQSKFEIGNYKNSYIEKYKEHQFNPCKCFITNNQSIKEYDFKNCLRLDDKKPNILLLGDSHAAQFSSSFRSLPQYNLLEANAGYTFPLKGAKGQKDSKQLMDYVYNEFIKENQTKIDLIILSVHWLMKNNSNLNYTDEDIEQEVSKTISFFKSKKIKFLVIGQSECYTLDYPRILMLKNLGRNPEEFEDLEAQEMNVFLKRIVPQENYIDIYNSSKIQHYDRINSVPYMFDSNHLTSFGANQIRDKIILSRIKQSLSTKN